MGSLKNFIQPIKTDSGTVISKEDKEQSLFSHFSDHLGSSAPRSLYIVWVNLDIPQNDHSALDDPIIVQEIREDVFSLPSVKAQGPNDFIGAFPKSCWEIVKNDVVAAIFQL